MKKNKIIMLLLIFLTTILFTLAINAAQINPGDYYSKGPDAADVKEMYEFGGSIAGVIQIVGTIISAGTLIIIGIRYVLASVEEKAEYKERMIPYVIGAVFLFGASNIVNVAYRIAQFKDTKNYYEIYGDLCISMSEIRSMDKYELDYYMSEVEGAYYYISTEATDEDILKDILDELNIRKKWASEVYEERINDRFREWFEYRGSETDEKAFQRMMDTNINAMSTEELKKLVNLMDIFLEYLQYNNFSDENLMLNYRNQIAIKIQEIEQASGEELAPNY